MSAMQGQSSREYAVEIPLMRYEEYSGEIIQFNTELIELRYRRHGSNKMDVICVHLSDPRIRIIYGDPRGGPGLIVLQGEAPISYNDARDPIVGILSQGPQNLVKVSRNGAMPVWVRSTHMIIKNEDLAAGQNTIAEQRRLFARGDLGQRVAPLGKSNGKLSPAPKGRGMSRPPVGSPAAKTSPDQWG
jgi:hypothetical protein